MIPIGRSTLIIPKQRTARMHVAIEARIAGDLAAKVSRAVNSGT